MRITMTHKNKKKPAHSKLKIFGKLLKYSFIMILIGFIFLTIFVAIIARDLPDPQQLASRQIGQTTKIYDRTGKILLHEIFNEQKRTFILVSDIPKFAVEATLAVEDKNFYAHKGIAFKSIARAILSNILGRKSGKGGASTLTQQLIKNAIIGNEHSLTRKLKEALLALQLEKKYSKQEILQLYFNEIPYGSTNYGIEAAAQGYFGKSAKDITLAEAATLAALPQAPTRYLNNAEELRKRRDYILDLMVQQNFVNDTDAKTAKSEISDVKQRIDNSIRAPHFVMMVMEQLSETLGEKTIQDGGLSVITSLDMDAQTIAEEEITKGVEINIKTYDARNAALVALDVPTGEIRALVGSRNFFDKEYDGEFNVATSPRQPGSSFKPIVYVSAFEKGYTPETIVYDVETTFTNSDGKPYEPRNYNLKEYGPVSLRTALQGSLNIPAVKMLYLSGIEYVLDVAKKLGYTTLNDRSRFGLSLVLGGGEVSLLEHTAAYAVFAREGVFIKTVAILEVRDHDNVELFKHSPQTPQQVIDKNAVLTLTNVLSDNASRAFIFGERSHLQLGDRPVAAKTGTTNDYRDGWLLGYTPSIAVGVWTGNNDNTQMKKGAGGSSSAGGIWNGFMKRVLQKTPIETFELPTKTESQKPIFQGVDPGIIKLEIDSVSGKLANEFTPPETREKKVFFVGHDILFHVNKDDPLGPPPLNPSDDPQYTAWENAVKKWAVKEDSVSGKVALTISEPPTEFDDVHKPEYNPTIRFIEPFAGVSVDRFVVARVETSALFGVTRVRYFLDGELISEAINSPSFETSLSLSSFEKGFHTLEARAYDPNFNVSATKIDVNLIGEPDIPTVRFTYPPPNTLLSAVDFPFTMQLAVTQPHHIQKITLTRVHSTTHEKKELDVFENNISKTMNYVLYSKDVSQGTYEISCSILYTNSTTSACTPLTITATK